MKSNHPRGRLRAISWRLVAVPLGLLSIFFPLMAIALPGIGWKLLCVAIGGVFGHLSVTAWQRARRFTVDSATTHLASDPRPPILYLRSFQDDVDGAKLAGGLSEIRGLPVVSTTEDEMLAEAFNELGPFTAIGNPDESLPTLGPSLFRFENETWKEEVTQLLSRASLVVFRAGFTPGLWWEVRQAVKNVSPERILFLLPFGKERYEAFREAAREVFPCSLPDFDGGQTGYGSIQGILCFSSEWVPQLIPLSTEDALAAYGIAPRKTVIPLLKNALQPVLQWRGLRWRTQPDMATGRLIGKAITAFWAFVLIGGLFTCVKEIARDPTERRIEEHRELLASALEQRAFAKGVFGSEAERHMQVWFDTGTQRLGAGDAIRGAELMLKMLTSVDVATCAGIMRDDQASRDRALGVLAPQELDQYFALVHQIFAAGADAPPVPEDEEALVNTLLLTILELPDDEQERFSQISQHIQTAGDQDLCWYFRTVLKGSQKLDSEQRARVARAIGFTVL